MSLLSWNCRGLGNPQTVRDLRQMVKEKRPKVVFIMETKKYNQRLDFLKIKLGMDNMFVVDSVGRSGGLVLLWKEDVNLNIQNYSRRHINALVKTGGGDLEWKLTCFYGHPETAKRKESWALLRHLSNLSPLPWLCLGDFNEIVSMSEQRGAVSKTRGQMEAFQRVLEECSLSDLGFCGPKFTWNNGRERNAFTQERLDRAVANGEWCDFFTMVHVNILANRSSDHHPLFITFEKDAVVRRDRKKIFRVEESWKSYADYKEVVKKIWVVRRKGLNPMANIVGKLNSSKGPIKQWVRKKMQASEDLIKLKTCELENLQCMEGNVDLKAEKELKDEIHGLLDQEESKWKQRAKEDWLRHGDRNTKYFHACANQRKRRNTIGSIRDVEGQEYTTPEGIETAFINYYKQLFSTEIQPQAESCAEAIQKQIPADMADMLVREANPDEILSALKQMAPLKAPGPDGYTADFYLQHWETVGVEVCDAICHFFNSDHMDSELNKTHIALIPKNNNPCNVSHFRPISLCNVIYKIISKVLANRLKMVLPHVISPNQSAFIPGRLITDNVMAAYETMHTMHTSMWSKVGFMGIKLDMSKAYDRVEWGFLEEVMKKMGFPNRWINWVMECVRSVTYSIIVNGQPVGHIKPMRGLRQGDPISPYLFLICAEALSAMLNQAEVRGVISGVPTSKRGPKISHLFFADDSLLFCKANSVEWRRLTKILDKYEAASGQKLNKEKTSIFFSRNTSAEKREEITRLSGLQATEKYEKYLGLPTLVGKSRVKAFKSIQDRVWNKLQNWKVKFLSQAGKEILLKAVVQAIPTFCMSVFLLPITLCKEINKLMQKF
jgi:hypothetical protein